MVNLEAAENNYDEDDHQQDPKIGSKTVCDLGFTVLLVWSSLLVSER